MAESSGRETSGGGMMGIRGTKTANEIRDTIIEEWKKHDWGWDTHTGQATIRLLPIVSAIMERELETFKFMVESLTDTVNVAEMESIRARDAVLLYNALKRSGMEKEDLTKAVCSFLDGEKIFEQTCKLDKEKTSEIETAKEKEV
jgi:hypothetical protein